MDRATEETVIRLKKSVIERLVAEVDCARAAIDFQNRMSKVNPNYPTPFEHAKTILYNTSRAGIGIDIPETPFCSALEIYDRLSLSLEAISKMLEEKPRGDDVPQIPGDKPYRSGQI